MKKKIDTNLLEEMTHDFPASLRDPRIKALGIASFVFYALAGFCAWQFGDWWGIGLVVSIFIVDTLDDFVHEEHRKEIIEMNDKLIRRIAENSDILEDVIPTKNS